MYSHWSFSGDSIYNYSTFFKKSYFLKNLLTTVTFSKFYIYKNTKIKNLVKSIFKINQLEILSLFKNHFLDKYNVQNFSIPYFIDTESFIDLNSANKKIIYQNIKKTLIKSKKDIFIVPGRVFVLKQQSNYIGIIHLFKPAKRKKKLKKQKKIKKIFNFLNLFKTVSLPTFFKKECFF